MMQWLLSFITAPVLGALVDGWKAKLAADNDQSRIAADLAGRELIVEQRELELNAQVVIAEQGRWYTSIWRPLLAAPVVIFMWKVIVWDTVLGLGVTPALKGDVASWAGAIITTYVGGRTIEKVAAIFKRK